MGEIHQEATIQKAALSTLKQPNFLNGRYVEDPSVSKKTPWKTKEMT